MRRTKRYNNTVGTKSSPPNFTLAIPSTPPPSVDPNGLSDIEDFLLPIPEDNTPPTTENFNGSGENSP